MVDIQNLHEITGDNHEALRSIIHLFMEKMPAQIEEIQGLIDTEDWPALEQACHKLKSSYAIFGAVDIREHLENIERLSALDPVDRDCIQEEMNTVVRLNPVIVEELKRIII